MEAKRGESRAPHQQLITGVRLASHSDFDRVVFDLVGSGAPGWITDFNADPVQAASGLPVTYDGSTALEVTLIGVSPWAQDGAQQPNLGTTPGTGGVVNEAISTVTLEGHSQFILGLDGTAPYSVTLLDEPQRVVVDILHE